MFKIKHLDHVAIDVENMEVSIKWYKEVLGLQQMTNLDKFWNGVPTMMFANQTGVALFPTKSPNLPNPDREQFKRIDHFAFYLTTENFAAAQLHYQNLNIDFHYKDHSAYESIYTKDPDGHIVELTTLKKSH